MATRREYTTLAYIFNFVSLVAGRSSALSKRSTDNLSFAVLYDENGTLDLQFVISAVAIVVIILSVFTISICYAKKAHRRPDGLENVDMRNMVIAQANQNANENYTFWG